MRSIRLISHLGRSIKATGNFKRTPFLRTFSVANVPNRTSIAAPSEKEPEDCKFEHAEREIARTTSYKEKIKLLWNKFGIIFVVSYLSVYGMTLGGLFVTLDSGLLTASSMGLEPADVIKNVRMLYLPLGHAVFPFLICVVNGCHVSIN